MLYIIILHISAIYSAMYITEVDKGVKLSGFSVNGRDGERFWPCFVVV